MDTNKHECVFRGDEGESLSTLNSDKFVSIRVHSWFLSSPFCKTLVFSEEELRMRHVFLGVTGAILVLALDFGVSQAEEATEAHVRTGFAEDFQSGTADDVKCAAIVELKDPMGVTGTFSIVAVDPEKGVCGAAVASKYPSVGTVVPYVRAGVGAFCTQHWHEPKWGERALDLLAEGKLPEEVLAELLRGDERIDKRQLAIIDMEGRAANRNPAKADPSGVYWGAMSGRYYACQGNTLVGRQVIVAMAQAYEETKGSLADRLMAALVAGDRVGGDHRGRLAAGIRVAKRGTPGYWLELQVDKSSDAVTELAKKYAELEHKAKGD
jgi:uncharacterized Ntn-hydrolase superfamily protein